MLTSPDIFPNKAKPKPWWRGQCLLYGLDAPQSLAIQLLREKLENALRRGELYVPDHLVELEHVENGKFRKLNAQVREATISVKKEGKGGGGAKKVKEDLLKKVLGTTKVAKKASAGVGKTAAPAAAPKPRAKKKVEVKPKVKPRAKAQAPPFVTATAGGDIQIYLTALPPAPAPAPAPRAKQTAKRGTGSAPKPRAPKAKPSKPPAATAKRGGGGPGSRGGRGSRGSRGGARGGGAAQSVKHEASSLPATRGRTKQTARCSTRGGPGGARGRGGWANGGISTARVKEEEEVHDGYGGLSSLGEGGGYSDDGYPYKSEYSVHSVHSGSDRVKEESDDGGYPYRSESSRFSRYSSSEGVKEESDDDDDDDDGEDRYYGYIPDEWGPNTQRSQMVKTRNFP